MPFKIVQTVENNELVLCVVPSQWEENGVLRWPKKSAVARLCRDENSCPKPSCETINCILKREFRTYVEANKEVERMEAIEDTEADENEPVQPTPKKVRHTNAKPPLGVFKDVNELVNNPPNEEEEETPLMTGNQVLVVDDSSIVCVENPNPDQQETQLRSIVVGDLPHTTFGCIPPANEGNKSESLPEATLAAISSNLLLLHNNQLKIMVSLAQITTSFEFLASKVLSIEKKLEAEPRDPTGKDMFKPVESLEDLNRLELELKDDSVMKRHVEKLSTICGTTGKADGIDSAYRLIDYMATREIMNMCSWTGLTRETTEPSGSDEFEAGPSKIPLKFYVKFRELFFRVVRLADHDFSEASCEKFLKGVLKNSKQRLTSKFTSAHKNRPKNLKYGSGRAEAKKSEDTSNPGSKLT